MSSLISGSDLSQPDRQPGSDAGDQDQDVATSPESLKAASGLLLVFFCPHVSNISDLLR